MLISVFIFLMERGLLPDSIIRWGVRRLCQERLDSLQHGFGGNAHYARALEKMPLAEATKEANQQHYEVPTEFFLIVLGENRKYSSAFYENSGIPLKQAERDALAETVAHAELTDGMQILELGCGWGSLTLYMASQFPNSKILGISNSKTQRLFIEAEAAKRGLHNIEIRTLNLAEVNFAELLGKDRFDRVVSVEMFEHFKNYKILLQRISQVLKVNGKLFVHIFTHQIYSYPFETDGEDNWMGRYFFTGGQMPAQDLFSEFQEDLLLDKQWNWSGTHYQLTSEAWLQNLDANKEKCLAIFERDMSPQEAKLWFHRWRVFFISVAELFGFKHGTEWGVSHYLFRKK